MQDVSYIYRYFGEKKEKLQSLNEIHSSLVFFLPKCQWVLSELLL